MSQVTDIAAIIFDLDGVLVDSEPLHFAALDRVLAREGRTLTEDNWQEFLGVTLRQTMVTLVNRLGLPGSAEEYESAYKEEVLLAMRGPLEPAPGARRLVEQLSLGGLKLGLASSSPRVWVEATLDSLGLAEFFEAIVAGDEVARGKPDPEIFLCAAAALGIAPSRCLVIEDSPHGVAGAVAAGMSVVAVRSSLTVEQPFSEAVLVVDGLADEALLRLCRPPLVP